MIWVFHTQNILATVLYSLMYVYTCIGSYIIDAQCTTIIMYIGRIQEQCTRLYRDSFMHVRPLAWSLFFSVTVI